MILFQYQGSGNLIDINEKEVKTNLRFSGFLNPKAGYP